MAQSHSTAKGSGIKHPYHMVEPSPWPMVGSFSALVLAFGALSYMHPEMFGPSLEPALRGLGIWKVLIGLVKVIAKEAGKEVRLFNVEDEASLLATLDSISG